MIPELKGTYDLIYPHIISPP